MRKIFKEDRLDAVLQETGFAIRPLLDREAVQRCMDVYKRFEQKTEDTKYNSLEINDLYYRSQVSIELRKILEAYIAELVIDYKYIGVNFAVKKAGSTEEFPMHIDDDHCDRSRFIGLNVWIPLIDVHKGNGGLYIVPKSHFLPPTINGIGSPFPYEDHRQLFLDNAHFVEMKAGEALFFDDRLIHGSLHNPTAEDRIAMISGMIPREADFIMYLNHDGLQWPDMELFEVDEDILLKLEIGKRPEGYKSQGVFKLEIPTLTRAEIVDMITCPTIL